MKHSNFQKQTPTHLSSHVSNDLERERLALILAEIVEQRAVHHELGDDPDGLGLGADGHQLHELGVAQLVHEFSLL